MAWSTRISFLAFETMITTKQSQQKLSPIKQESLQSLNLVAILEQMPLEELQATVDNLSKDLQRGVQFASIQEEELTCLCQAIAELEEKLKAASEDERLSLNAELADEKERKKLLEAMLISQCHNIRKREATLKKHSRILQNRQGILEAKHNERQVEPKTFQELLDEPLESVEAGQKPKRKRLQETILIFLPIVGLLITGATSFYALQLAHQPPSRSPELAQENQESNAVAALGYLEPKGEVIDLSAPIGTEGARVNQLLVKQGDRVKAGQIVAILDSRDRLQAALEQAKTQVKIAQARLEQIEAGAKKGDIQAQDARFERSQAELEGQVTTQSSTIASLKAQSQGERTAQEATVERLKAELKNAQKDCERYRSLYQDGVVSEQDRDGTCLKEETVQKSLQEAQANLNRIVNTWQDKLSESRANLNRTVTTLQRQVTAEKAALNSVAEVRPVDVQVVRGEVQGAQMAVKKAQADLDLAYVRSPRGGQILKIHTWPGEIVSEQGIVNLGQTDQMYVTAEVYETDIYQVRVGQRVTVKSDGVVGNLEGRVDEIGLQIDKQKILGTDPSADADARVVEVKIRLNPEASKQVEGLTNLQVHVIIDTSTPQTISQSQK